MAAQQVVEAIVKNQCANTIEEVGDAAHNEVPVDGEEEGVVHTAVLAQRGEEWSWRAGEEVPHVKAADDVAGLSDQVV